MNRTKNVLAFLLGAGLLVLRAQEPQKPAAPAPEADAIAPIVAAIREAEKALTSARLELVTIGRLPGGLELSTRGVLHVLRGAQPALHTAVEFSFGDGIAGRMEAAQTNSGITVYEDDPVFGEIHVHIEPAIAADLEWAGTVLERADLPGMVDRRALAPLGSSMLEDLRRHFDLAVEARTEREGEAGQWLGGKSRGGLDEADPDLPLADRVELFVRQRDHALVEVKHLQGETVLQHIVVNKLELGLELPAATFVVDGRGEPLRAVQSYHPMWGHIEKVLLQAELESADGVVRPSKRK
jgi:hypothetical protein